MGMRDDALVKAAQEMLRMREEAMAIEDAVLTVGQIEAEPGGINVIPGRVRFSMDIRAPDQERLDRLVAIAGIDGSGAVPPTEMSPAIRAALREEIEARGLPVVELASGAGHDAGVLAPGRRAERDALRPQPERRRLALARRALLRGGHRARDRRARRDATPSLRR